MASNNNTLSKALVLSTTIPAPPRPLVYKPFNFLKSLSLKSVGIGLEDIPFNCGRELVFLVGSIACPIKLELEDAPSGPQDKILETSGENFEKLEPCSFGLFPETAPETGDEPCANVVVEDLHDDLRGSSDETSEENEEKEPLPEAEPTGPAEKRKRVKMVARHTRTPRTRPQPRSQPSHPLSSSQPSKPSRKSARIAFQSTPRTSKPSAPVIEEISSSSSEGLSDSDSENTPFKQGTPVFSESSEEKAPPKPTTKPASKPSPSITPVKRKAKTAPLSKIASSVPPLKRSKQSTPSPMSDRLAQLLKRNVVRGKVVNIKFFEEHGLQVFLNKLRAQGWLDLFANTQLGCSVPELAEFYANCAITEGVVTSTVSGTGIQFDATTLGTTLGVPSHGFAMYVREDKTALEPAQLLEVSRRLSQKQGLQTPRSIKKGELTSLHQLLFMFVIRNIIPRGQGRNSADAFDQVLVDLLDREEPINLPAIMIRHIGRIANTTRPHDLGYGFLLTRVFEHFGIELKRRTAAQLSDEIGIDTLLGCGYEIGVGSVSKQGRRPPRQPVSGQPSKVEAVLEDNTRLKDELSAVKAALAKEQALSAKRHEDLLARLSTLAPSIPPLQTKPPPAP